VRGVLQRQCTCGQHIGGGEQCEECKKKGMTWQRQASGSAVSSSVPPVVHEVLNSPGKPLDLDTRAFMEPRFGQDFSQVRVHADTKAADSADAVHAHAYTVGKDIVFGPRKYSPHAETSRHLLAHELTHVVQQTTSGVGADSETMANAAAARISRGQDIDGAALGGAAVSLQKSPKDDAVAGTGLVGSASNSTEPPVDEFGFDKTDIPPQHLARLAALRTRLLNAPGATVILTGHTDTVGKEKYNEDLGLRRAKAVRDFLSAKKGVNPSRIEIKSRGEVDPAAGQPPAKVDPDKGEKNPKNRRVEIQVVGLPATDTKTDLPSDRPTTPGPDKDDAGKKKPDFRLPPEYDPGPPSSGRDTGTSSTPTTTEKRKEGGLEAEGSVVVDPNAKPEKGSSRVGRAVETQIEVSYQESTGNRRILPKFSVTLHVGPNGFEEVEAELTLIRQKLKSQILWGTAKNLTFSVSLNPGVNFDKSTANRVIPDFSAKVKAALSADLGIPGTSIKIPVEASVYADPLGKPGGELKITVFTF
jgi:outer membrane protein OmpA-like peptidoglycan-associated protein